MNRRTFLKTIPVNIFYVVDIAKYKKAPFQEPGLKDREVQKSYYYVATGLIASNVYLFAASQGLAAHFHNCDKTNTPKEFKLRPDQRVLFAQTVGYPAGKLVCAQNQPNHITVKELIKITPAAQASAILGLYRTLNKTAYLEFYYFFCKTVSRSWPGLSGINAIRFRFQRDYRPRGLADTCNNNLRVSLAGLNFSR